MMIELSVIIVNYNGLKYLKDCFASLHDTLQGIAYEIIVLDNNSADASCDYIKANNPEVILIESKDNLGFGKGNNAAVKQARGAYLLLINNDTIVLNVLKPVLDIVKNDANIGAVGIKMLSGTKEYLPVVGNFPGPQNLIRFKNLYRSDNGFKTGNFTADSYEVDWFAGSFVMMPKHVYDEINGFDDDYFMYGEDVDFCKKISNKGYKKLFLPNYSYIHYVGYNSSKGHLVVRGLDLYIQKHTHGVFKLMCLAAINTNKTVKRVKKILNLN
jgi:GT2 family glycosyltransferase